MTLDDLFVTTDDKYRICSECGERKHVSEFYKDGKRNGLIRYRRDCKNCYRKKRIRERRYKRR
jgi:hypothetical protein